MLICKVVEINSKLNLKFLHRWSKTEWLILSLIIFALPTHVATVHRPSYSFNAEDAQNWQHQDQNEQATKILLELSTEEDYDLQQPGEDPTFFTALVPTAVGFFVFASIRDLLRFCFILVEDPTELGILRIDLIDAYGRIGLVRINVRGIPVIVTFVESEEQNLWDKFLAVRSATIVSER